MQNNPWYYWTDHLVKEPKPAMPGNQVHIMKWRGCFTVHRVFLTHFIVKKNGTFYNIPWTHYICLKGKGQSAEAMLKRGVRESLMNINILSTTLTDVLKDLRT